MGLDITGSLGAGRNCEYSGVVSRETVSNHLGYSCEMPGLGGGVFDPPRLEPSGQPFSKGKGWGSEGWGGCSCSKCIIMSLGITLGLR